MKNNVLLSSITDSHFLVTNCTHACNHVIITPLWVFSLTHLLWGSGKKKTNKTQKQGKYNHTMFSISMHIWLGIADQVTKA